MLEWYIKLFNMIQTVQEITEKCIFDNTFQISLQFQGTKILGSNKHIMCLVETFC